ncbi:hypothetical protein Csa_007868 [Cucumis sativus]|uniref:Uncharacterized protein n=1 Tax=Cucumis sativus TaxID=3659 RepID=A0A0A0KPX2_CUCSA|nr:hypothetical protein Csa_007868 [Cucumis sativus]
MVTEWSTLMMVPPATPMLLVDSDRSIGIGNSLCELHGHYKILALLYCSTKEECLDVNHSKESRMWNSDVGGVVVSDGNKWLGRM